MVTEVTDQEPVLVLNDKKYIISDLSDEAKYCVAQLQSIQNQIGNSQASLDQLQMASVGFTDKLTEHVESDDTEPVEEPTVN